MSLPSDSLSMENGDALIGASLKPPASLTTWSTLRLPS